MKLAFSTLGIPGTPLAEVARLAAETGYQGVELRAHPEEPVHPGSGAAERADAVREFRRAKVEILTVAGYARVAAAGDDHPVIQELADLCHLARDLGAAYVRVFPGGGELTAAAADQLAVRRLQAAAQTAADLDVRILLETHDSHRTGRDVARVVGAVDHPHIGALWDVMHPWLGGESPRETHTALRSHLGYVQVKDIAARDDRTPLPLGQGVLPLAECLTLTDPDGWVCWEYEKRWYPKAQELPGLLTLGRDRLLGVR